jgi:hypothetical protein
MAAQPQDQHAKNVSPTVGPPGKVVPDAIGTTRKAPSGADQAEDVTTPAEAFGDARPKAGEAATLGTSPQVPGKAVPDALSETGKR